MPGSPILSCFTPIAPRDLWLLDYLATRLAERAAPGPGRLNEIVSEIIERAGLDDLPADVGVFVSLRAGLAV